MQALIRGYIARQRMERLRIKDEAAKRGVLVAVAGTIQGENGWYVASDGMVYYFIMNENNWLLAAGPITFETYDEILQTQVKVVHSLKYAHAMVRAPDSTPIISPGNGVMRKAMNGQAAGGQVGAVSRSALACPPVQIVSKRESEVLLRCKYVLQDYRGVFIRGPYLYTLMLYSMRRHILTRVRFLANIIITITRFDLCIERADLDGEVFMDKKTRNLFLAVSVDKLIKKSEIVD